MKALLFTFLFSILSPYWTTTIFHPGNDLNNMAVVKSPYFKVTYEGKDITEDVSDSVLSVSYSDAVEGESDELKILLHDFSGKWKNEWRSNNGDTIAVQIGYSEDDMLDCGSFEIDKVKYKGQPDTVELSGLAVGVNNSLKEHKSRPFENQTIRQIARAIAEENGLTLVSYFPVVQAALAQTIGESLRANQILDMKLLRAVQNRESDLAFLNRIGNKFGVSFNVRGDQLYFLLVYDLDSVTATRDVAYYEITDVQNEAEANRETAIHMKSYDLVDNAEKVVAGVDVRYQNPITGEAFIFKLDNDTSYAQAMIDAITKDVLARALRRLKVYETVENAQQAEAVASARLYKSVSRQVEGSIEMEGTASVVAGTAFNVSGLGWLNGRYFVEKSYHSITRSGGYTTRASVKFLG
jgi:phage protein D